MNRTSSAGGCPYLYSWHQHIGFSLYAYMSLLKRMIPFLSWPPSSSFPSFSASLYCVIDVLLTVLPLPHTLMQHRGTASNTRGTAFVVYEDIFDAKNACEHLSGFNVCNRYLVVLYYQPHKVLCLEHFRNGLSCYFLA